MEECSKPFLWIDLVRPAHDCEESGFGVYVLGPTNYDPESFIGAEVLQLLCWDQSKRYVRAKVPNAIDPFGPIFTPGLLARVWQAPRQDVLALNVEPSFADELSSSQTRYLTTEPIKLVSFMVRLEWNEEAFVCKHERPKSPYQDDPRYRATAERLRRKGIHEESIKPDLRKDAIGIPVSICFRSKDGRADGILTLQSEQPPVATIILFLAHESNEVRPELGSTIEYRGKVIASVLPQ